MTPPASFGGLRCPLAHCLHFVPQCTMSLDLHFLQEGSPASSNIIGGLRHLLGKRDRYGTLAFTLRRRTHDNIDIASQERQTVHQLSLREASELTPQHLR
jgi:hypothetical protein